MHTKHTSKRLKRAKKTTALIKLSGQLRFCVHRSSKHIYAQIVQDFSGGSKTIMSASSVGKKASENLTGAKCDKARALGITIAKQALEKNITQVAFDRRGFKYHGVIQAIADGAREGGLII